MLAFTSLSAGNAYRTAAEIPAGSEMKSTLPETESVTVEKDSSRFKSAADSMRIVEKYRILLDSLAEEFSDEMAELSYDISDNPLYFRLFMPITFYYDAVKDVVEPDEVREESSDDGLLPYELKSDNDAKLTRHINDALMQVYLEHPELVKMTQSELMDVKDNTALDPVSVAGINMAVIQGNRGPLKVEQPDMVYAKPKYWKTIGNFQGKYTQNYVSDNWYKGGSKNHSILVQTTLDANYAKNDFTWDNKLEMKLGYYTTDMEGKNKFKTNQDQLRFTSKVGLKAFTDWYYSSQFQAYTQFMPVWDNKNPDKLKSRFMAPAYANLSVGLDYKPKFKNKNVTFSAQLSPLSFDSRYSAVDSIATSFGIEQGKKFKKTIGSKIDVNLKWTFLENFKWTSKTQYFTNYEYVEANLENTLDYQLSKYFSLQFFVHVRFDDSAKKKDPELGYYQLKEFFTLNFNYSW